MSVRNLVKEHIQELNYSLIDYAMFPEDILNSCWETECICLLSPTSAAVLLHENFFFSSSRYGVLNLATFWNRLVNAVEL